MWESRNAFDYFSLKTINTHHHEMHQIVIHQQNFMHWRTISLDHCRRNPHASSTIAITHHQVSLFLSTKMLGIAVEILGKNSSSMEFILVESFFSMEKFHPLYACWCLDLMEKILYTFSRVDALVEWKGFHSLPTVLTLRFWWRMGSHFVNINYLIPIRFQWPWYL